MDIFDDFLIEILGASVLDVMNEGFVAGNFEALNLLGFNQQLRCMLCQRLHCVGTGCDRVFVVALFDQLADDGSFPLIARYLFHLMIGDAVDQTVLRLQVLMILLTASSFEQGQS